MAPKAATLMGLLAVGCASGQARVPANPSPGCFSTAARAANISYPTAANISVGGIVRTYWAYAPLRPRYDEKLPGSEDRAHAEEESMPLVLNFHGWRGNAFDHMNDVGGNLVAEMGTFVIVYPGGMGDNPDQTQSWGSWNAVGSTASPGPFGPTCRGGDLSLCYASCSARAQGCDPHGCDWTTCADDVGFVQALVDELESTMCIDRNRIFATGFSNVRTCLLLSVPLLLYIHMNCIHWLLLRQCTLALQSAQFMLFLNTPCAPHVAGGDDGLSGCDEPL